MIPLALVPLALGETWFAVFGGMIPIVGLALIGAVLWHAAKPPKQPPPSDQDGDQR
ncbi:MAG: hypothetical protein AB7V58_17355 [Solirubrobacterales bacterium]